MRDLPKTMEPVFADGKEIAPEGFEFITRESVGKKWIRAYYCRRKNKTDMWDLFKGRIPGWQEELIYIRPIPEKAEEAKALFLQVVPQTHEEKIAMYMGLPQKDVVEMLINCNTLLESQSGISKAEEVKEVAKPEYKIHQADYVSGYLQKGWKLHGSAFCDANGFFRQPMTRNL